MKGWEEDLGREYDVELVCRPCDSKWWTKVIGQQGATDYEDPECPDCKALGVEEL